MARVVVLDASVLIGHLEASDPHHARATELLIDAAGSALAASTLTLAEVLVGPAQAGRLADARAALRTLDVSEVALGADAAARLALLRAERLDPAQPDAHYRLARLYRAMGNVVAAEREFARVSELQEKSEDMAPKMSSPMPALREIPRSWQSPSGHP